MCRRKCGMPRRSHCTLLASVCGRSVASRRVSACWAPVPWLERSRRRDDTHFRSATSRSHENTDLRPLLARRCQSCPWRGDILVTELDNDSPSAPLRHQFNWGSNGLLAVIGDRQPYFSLRLCSGRDRCSGCSRTGNLSYGTAINDSGTIVGWSNSSPNGSRQAIFSQGSEIVPLGTFGGSQSSGNDINIQWNCRRKRQQDRRFSDSRLFTSTVGLPLMSCTISGRSVGRIRRRTA